MKDYENNTGVPSVSDIISPWVDRRWFKPEHSERGSQVHERIDCHLNFDFMPDFNPEYQNYFDSFLEFEKNRIEEVLFSEKRLVSKKYKFCGKPDIVFSDIDKLITLGDWKTSVSTAKYWGLQLGGYSILLRDEAGIKCEKGLMIRLRRDPGKKALVNVYDLMDCERLFLNQLELFNLIKG